MDTDTGYGYGKLENKGNDIRKFCKFNNKGYCREKESCLFFHSDTVCEVYQATGVCWKLVCRKRHPKICRYGEKCYRGKSCVYLHLTIFCDRCEQMSCTRYYCEFCKKSFCESCTIEKAHVDNIYANINIEDPKCEHIHQ